MPQQIDLSNYSFIINDTPIPQRLYQAGVTDKTALRQALEIIYNDPLTSSAYNRLYFEDIVCRRNVISNPKTFFGMLDIDHFKKVNDTYGHQAGDAVLRVFADKVSETANQKIIRYGGEEFMLISQNPDELYKKIEKARQAISSLVFVINEKQFSINFSAGIGKTPKDADEYLYQAKNSGRGKTEVSPEIQHNIQHGIEVIHKFNDLEFNNEMDFDLLECCAISR